MDEDIQAAQGINQGRDPGLAGGTAQPCEVAKGKPGRRKSIRPIAPELARELVVTIRHFLPELAVWLGGVKDKRDPKLVTFPLKVLLRQGVLRKIDPVMLERVLAASIRRLIRMKALEGWRVGGRFLLAIDGTGMRIPSTSPIARNASKRNMPTAQ